ncbi:MAG: PKD domain-containing protein [Dehalococcoidia bacterium]|jgi:PKD repeat protein|nr:PKD domain-containing protein [Dehalococcoidia bacterium]
METRIDAQARTSVRGMRGLAVSAMACALALTGVACKVKSADPGPLGGPSEFGTSITITATPSTLLKDGRSTADVVITARGPNGERLGSIAATVEICSNGSLGCYDIGKISTRSIVTGGNGRASLTYRAPESTTTDELVFIQVTPQGTDAANSLPRRVQINLRAPGSIGPPFGVPTAAFSTGGSLQAGGVVTFDGSTSTVGVNGAPIISYDWDFGDGSAGSGELTTHTYDAPGTYIAALTVSNGVNSDKDTQTVTITAGTAPTASFTVTPTAPDLGERTFFNAIASTAAAGRELVGFFWDFSDNRKAQGVTTVRHFNTPGDVDVTLTVRDDIGNEGITSTIVTVAGPADPDDPGLATASFTSSPSSPSITETVNFDATASTASEGATIDSYAWNFGDGSTGTGVTTTHSYTLDGTYTVTLTVIDSTGSTDVTSGTVTVGDGDPTAAIAVSPTDPAPAETVNLSAAESTATGSATITSYSWDFGNGSTGTGRTTTTSYATASTYTITLTVTDSEGRTDTETTTVTVS